MYTCELSTAVRVQNSGRFTSEISFAKYIRGSFNGKFDWRLISGVFDLLRLLLTGLIFV